LAQAAPGVPAELQRIVRKALRKDAEERYQTVKDMALDLKNLRREMDVEAELEYSAQRLSTSAALSGSVPSVVTTATVNQSGTDTAAVTPAHHTSSAEYLACEIKCHKTGALVIGAVVVIGVAVLGVLTQRRDSKSVGNTDFK
jgi:hypothetical protein